MLIFNYYIGIITETTTMLLKKQQSKLIKRGEQLEQAVDC